MLPIRTLDLALEVLKLILEGQTVEQRQQFTAWLIEDVKNGRELLARLIPPA